MVVALPAGQHFLRGDDGYEAARRATVWNGRVPPRYPDVIVQARDSEDVVTALRYADAGGLRVTVCSGGRSWHANHLRDGGLLLDVGRLDHCAVDADRMTAVVGPGKEGSVLAAELDAEGLFFPTGHCTGVALGGYLLQGGYGWNSRRLGPACESVLAVDVVTADGRRLYCDAEHHPDLYWAARGAGPGFCGVVTAFHLALHPRPAVCAAGLYVYPLDVLDEVFTWARRIGAEVDRRIEMQVVVSRAVPAIGLDQPAIVVVAPVFADTEDEAIEALALLDTCPVVGQALVRAPYVPKTLATLYEEVMSNCPAGYRYATDNMWSSASAADLLPGIRRAIDTMPPYPAQLLLVNWGAVPSRPDMAFSLEDDVFLTLYSSWQDPADDDKYADWARSNMAAMEALASGTQLADENLGQRPARFAADAAMARLDSVRAAYDPHGRFQAWMGRL
ncbi:FAD-binding oxidoreductase [Streptomyces canus]|uniref:FAD-binding oxidoreductase n=1 Tax=Streptomyces canus TaxID=58343 RepID=UPI00371E1A6A